MGSMGSMGGPYGGSPYGSMPGGSPYGAGVPGTSPYGVSATEVAGEKGTIKLTGYLKVKMISADPEANLALQIEDLKRTLQNVKDRERLQARWNDFKGLNMPRAPRDETLTLIHKGLKGRKSALEKQIEPYLKDRVIPKVFMTEGSLDKLLSDAGEELNPKSKEDYDALLAYNTSFETMLRQFNYTAGSDFLGDIEVKESKPLDFYRLLHKGEDVAKFELKANLNRPIDF
jgi:hypothetical protein